MRHLLENLPESMWGRWLSVAEIHSQLRRGGFPNMPKITVSRAFRFVDSSLIRRRECNHTVYYMFGKRDSFEAAPRTPKDQIYGLWSKRDCRLSERYYFHHSRQEGSLKPYIDILVQAGYSAMPNASATTPVQEKENPDPRNGAAVVTVNKAPAVSVAESNDKTSSATPNAPAAAGTNIAVVEMTVTVVKEAKIKGFRGAPYRTLALLVRNRRLPSDMRRESDSEVFGWDTGSGDRPWCLPRVLPCFAVF